MEYHSAVKKEELLPFVIAWMDLESVTLIEISQSENYKYKRGAWLGDWVKKVKGLK